MKSTQRLDEILIASGFAADKKTAFIIVTEGRVFVDGQKTISPAQMVRRDAKVEVRQAPRYVGRGGEKLEAAIEKFGIDARGKVCADIGAATGGFTDVLLQHGAKKVYAIDTARGKLALKLRQDRRVAVMEGIDVRDIDRLVEPAELITIDVSLIPLEKILPHAARLMASDGAVAALLKPQYETRDPAVLHHGVVRDQREREKIRDRFIAWARAHGWVVEDWMESPIKGSEGNTEYLLLLRRT